MSGWNVETESDHRAIFGIIPTRAFIPDAGKSYNFPSIKPNLAYKLTAANNIAKKNYKPNNIIRYNNCFKVAK